MASSAGLLPTPAYDRRRVTTGVVHFGVGGFHRAHQAMYHDRLMNRVSALEWGICGVGVMPADRRMKDALAAQDGLYTLVVKHGNGRYEPHVIGSITEYLFSPDDPEAVIEKLADASTRIVSLTVTEGGYHLDHVTGEFDAADPGVARDLEPGTAPRTTFGLIAEGLRRRRERGLGAFTVMSCDNLQGSGRLTRRALTAFARLRDPGLAGWIEREVRFPNSMVDRITPATTDADRAAVRERFGLEDRWPVVCEPFTQWVLEDAFSAGRPPYEDAGGQVVDDVERYELMKLRLLNAKPSGAGILRAAVRLRARPRGGAGPALPRLPARLHERGGDTDAATGAGVDVEEYKRTLIERFSNSQVRDTIARLGAESSDRISKWVLPVIRHQRATGREIRARSGDRRELGALCGGRRRAGRADRGRRPPARRPDGDRRTPARGPAGVDRQP